MVHAERMCLVGISWQGSCLTSPVGSSHADHTIAGKFLYQLLVHRVTMVVIMLLCQNLKTTPSFRNPVLIVDLFLKSEMEEGVGAPRTHTLGTDHSKVSHLAKFSEDILFLTHPRKLPWL